MEYIILGFSCLLAWSFFGLVLAISWLMIDDPSICSDFDSTGEPIPEYILRLQRLPGWYIAFMGGPFVWCCFVKWRK